MKNMKRHIYILLFIVLAFSACGSKEYNHKNEVAAEEASYINQDATEPALESEQSQEKKIIKNADLEISTDDYFQSLTKIRALFKQFNVLIISETEEKNDYNLENNLSLKIKSDSLEAFIAVLEKNEFNIKSKSINSDDRTKYFYDQEARMNNNIALENRYKEILKSASKVSDILEIEAKINDVRNQIDAMKAELKNIDYDVKLSTLNIRLYQRLPYKYEGSENNSFIEQVKKAFADGWSYFLDFILMIIRSWFLILFAILAVYLFKKIKRKLKGKQNG